MTRLIIKYGIIGGLVSSLLGTLNWLLIAGPLGVQASETVGYTSIVLSLLCIPLGVRYYRDKLNHEVVSFGKALKIGLGITAVAAVVMGIHSILFFALQKEEFMAWQRANMSAAELTAFNEQLAQMPEFVFNPWFQGVVMFLTVFLIGAVINLVSALILKK